MQLPSEQTYREILRSAQVQGLFIGKNEQLEALKALKKYVRARVRNSVTLKGDMFVKKFVTVQDIKVSEPFLGDQCANLTTQPNERAQQFHVRLRKPHGCLRCQFRLYFCNSIWDK